MPTNFIRGARPAPGRTHNDSNKEELFHVIIKTQQLIRELAGIKD